MSPNKPILALDVSSYQSSWLAGPQYRPDLAAMRDHGFRHVQIKASMGFGYDPYAIDLANLFRSYGYDVSIYHWTDPTSTPERQIGFIQNKRDAIKPAKIFLDIEQEKTWDGVLLTPRQIVDAGNGIITGMSEAADILECYTYPSFLADHCISTSAPAVRPDGIVVTGHGYSVWDPFWSWWRDIVWPWPIVGSRRKEANPWVGFYISVPTTKRVMTSWEQFDLFLQSEVVPKNPISLGHTNLLNAGNWSWWQFVGSSVGSSIVLPGYTKSFDHSIFNGDEIAYKNYMDCATADPITPPVPDQPGQPPADQPTPTMIVEIPNGKCCNIRSAPNGTAVVLRYAYNGEKISVVYSSGQYSYIGNNKNGDKEWIYTGFLRSATSQVFKVVPSLINVRNNPSSSATWLRYAVRGEIFIVSDQKNGYSYVGRNNMEGNDEWVYSSYLVPA